MRDGSLSPGPPGKAVFVILLLTAALAPLIQIQNIARAGGTKKGDLAAVWMGARAALNRRNPYSDEVTREIQTDYFGNPFVPADDVNKMTFAYPVYTAFFFLPVAHLSWTATSLTFLLVVPGFLVLSVLWWARVVGVTLSPARITAVVVLALASWPVMWGFRLQQPTLPFAVLVAAACLLLTRERGIAAGTVLALTTIKPQLAGPLIAWVLLWACTHRMWRFVISFAASLSALLVAAQWLVPGWFRPWLGATAEYARYRRLRPVLEVVFGHWFGMLALLFLLTVCAVLLWRLRACPAGSNQFGAAVALTLAATVCALPSDRSMIYNQVMLLPAFLIITFNDPVREYARLVKHFALIVLGWGFLSVVICVAAEWVFGPAQLWLDLPSSNALLPVFATVGIACLLWDGGSLKWMRTEADGAQVRDAEAEPSGALVQTGGPS